MKKRLIRAAAVAKKETEHKGLSVCIVGVQHDAVEARLESALLSFSYVGVCTFWESRFIYGTRSSSGSYSPVSLPRRHYGLEDRVLSTLTFLHSAVVALVSNVSDDLFLGHDDFVTVVTEMFEKGEMRGRSVWDGYTDQERILFSLMSGYFHGLCIAIKTLGMHQSLEVLRRELGSQEVLDEFQALGAGYLDRLTFSGCYLDAEPQTMSALREYLVDYEALLFRRRAVLGPLLAESVDILSALVDETLDLPRFMHMFTQIYARIRDIANWRYASAKAERKGCRGVLLIVGTGHVLHLKQLLDEDARVHNVTVVLPPDAPRSPGQPRTTQYAEVTRHANLMQQEIDAWQGSI